MVAVMHKLDENETLVLDEQKLREVLTKHYRAFVHGVRIEGKNVLVEFVGLAPRHDRAANDSTR